jgi:hypothetical protein
MDLERAGDEPSPLSKVLRQTGITHPGQMRGGRVIGKRTSTEIPVAVRDTLAPDGPETRRTREYIEHELLHFATDLEAQAQRGGQPSAALVGSARRYLDVYGPGYTLVRLYDAKQKRAAWALDPGTITAWVATELAALYLTRPKLRRCVLCDAVFVARPGVWICNGNLWQNGTDLLARCADDARIAEYNATHTSREHDRQRRRLNEALRRAIQNAGGDLEHELVVGARRRRDTYMEKHGRRRGPAPRVAPPQLDLITDDSAS